MDYEKTNEPKALPMKKFNASITRRINEYRLQKGISWEKLAYSSGISKGAMSDIKRGLRDPKISTICKIATALEVSVSEFFNFNIDLSELD